MTKKVFKFITVDNVEKEEAFLEEMANQGWFFSKYASLRYHFEQGEPAEYTYCIDYKEEAGDEEEYLALFEDAGWEHVYAYPILSGKWMYFRKAVKEGAPKEAIFTDDASMVVLWKTIRSRWTWFGGSAILMLIVVGIATLLASVYLIGSIFTFAVALFLIVLYGKMYIRITRKIKLRS
ncbi:hypothetical protein BMT55_02425 [Listeria newyorkensis]|uniref:DUF2812 domain-containing protein n=1 Tax=Listeria newyorkensis TaxID=1497681 RepID=A0ABX4XSP5_9LIST|nr:MULTISPECIES: DUF2812 domain-containing protein [Listeria]PNP94361.1 hypothetical protein BMT55_02425 [Listeria newyorkensis]RQW67678.1 DUF2812 domain-containing protein [Listeria sp. SHR_NRA_18]WAO22778.1 DUF2812 domain-containing protein [Listeria newyorkensis]SQC54102.1 Protein of uncharacterised function (DUF2812) [Listeria newyorkensis]